MYNNFLLKIWNEGEKNNNPKKIWYPLNGLLLLSLTNSQNICKKSYLNWLQSPKQFRVKYSLIINILIKLHSINMWFYLISFNSLIFLNIKLYIYIYILLRLYPLKWFFIQFLLKKTHVQCIWLCFSPISHKLNPISHRKIGSDGRTGSTMNHRSIWSELVLKIIL